MIRTDNTGIKPSAEVSDNIQLKGGMKFSDTLADDKLHILFVAADSDDDGVLSDKEAYIFNNSEMITDDNDKKHVVYPGLSIGKQDSHTVLGYIDSDKDGVISKNEIELYKKLSSKEFLNKNDDNTLLQGGLMSASLALLAGGYFMPRRGKFQIASGILFGIASIGVAVAVLLDHQRVNMLTKKAQEKFPDLINSKTQMSIFAWQEGKDFKWQKYSDVILSQWNELQKSCKSAANTQ